MESKTDECVIISNLNLQILSDCHKSVREALNNKYPLLIDKYFHHSSEPPNKSLVVKYTGCLTQVAARVHNNFFFLIFFLFFHFLIFLPPFCLFVTSVRLRKAEAQRLRQCRQERCEEQTEEVHLATALHEDAAGEGPH